MNAVGLQEPTAASTDFSFDMTIPPIGGQALAAVAFLGRFDSDVIGAFELNDVRGGPGHAGVATARGVGGET